MNRARTPPISKTPHDLQYYSLSREIANHEREIKFLEDQINLITERFEELEAQIVTNSRLIKKRKAASKNAKIGIYTAAIAIAILLGISVHKSEESMTFKYDGNNLIGLIVTICGGGGAIYGIANHNKEKNFIQQSEEIFSNY